MHNSSDVSSTLSQGKNFPSAVTKKRWIPGRHCPPGLIISSYPSTPMYLSHIACLIEAISLSYKVGLYSLKRSLSHAYKKTLKTS